MLDNVSDPKGRLGENQLQWLEADVKRQSPDAQIIVLAHRPLFELYPQWDWWTGDGAQAVNILMNPPKVTVFYGHIHQEHHLNFAMRPRPSALWVRRTASSRSRSTLDLSGFIRQRSRLKRKEPSSRGALFLPSIFNRSYNDRAPTTWMTMDSGVDGAASCKRSYDTSDTSNQDATYPPITPPAITSVG
jgi:3',5'-cyclic AMP phosphodiesterase CpdA